MRLLLLLLFFGISSLLLWSQGNPSQPVNIKAKYDSARVEYTQFEKKHGRFVQTKNAKMHYLEWGNPRHIPFIWVHGSFTNAYEFADLSKELVQKGYYVIAIDYYGHGQTPIPTHDVSLYHVADDIKTLMSVSYTHLDVYKRQEVMFAFFKQEIKLLRQEHQAGKIALWFYDEAGFNRNPNGIYACGAARAVTKRS